MASSNPRFRSHTSKRQQRMQQQQRIISKRQELKTPRGRNQKHRGQVGTENTQGSNCKSKSREKDCWEGKVPMREVKTPNPAWRSQKRGRKVCTSTHVTEQWQIYNEQYNIKTILPSGHPEDITQDTKFASL